MNTVTLPPKQLKKDKVSFSNTHRPLFSTLQHRISEYFASNGIKKTGNTELYTKSIFFLIAFFAGFATILLADIPAVGKFGVYAFLGSVAAAIGFNLMHDGAHGSFSDKKWVNTLAAYSINLLGGDALLWKNKHNIIHHTYTNIEGFDQDIAQMPVFRMNVYQKKSAFHKYQHIYCFLVYGLSSLLWIFLLDYQKYFSGKIGNHKMPAYTAKDHFIFWLTKISYLGFYIALPIYVCGPFIAITGFFIYHFVLGLILSVVFQLAHVVEETEFCTPPSDGKVQDEWALHQLKTTTNFATKNKFITWYTGGLNYQVEHHLFPHTSHIHYPKLSKIVKEVCQEMDAPYHEFSSFRLAVSSHVEHLRQTGIA